MNNAIQQYLKKHGFEALRPRAVLFDMDGVLYDSMPNHAVAWRRSMAEFGIDMTTEQAYATEGQRGVDTIRQMVLAQQQRHISEAEAQVMYNEKSRLFHQMPEAPLMPGVKELMAQIHALGISIGVVTGSGQRPLIARLEQDFRGFLKHKNIVTAYDVERGKPHPDPYLQGMRQAGNLMPWETIVVENAPLGVEAGVAAQAFTICVNSGHLPVRLFEQRGASIVFDSMQELSTAWPGFGFKHPCVHQDERWDRHYAEIMAFLDEHGRRPSKYYPSEVQMVNWVKFNRKMRSRGLMPQERLQRFSLLERRFENLRRINQHSYLHS